MNEISYEEFIDGEKNFGTEYNLSSFFEETSFWLQNSLQLSCGSYSSIKERINSRKEKSNEDASRMLYAISKAQSASPQRVLCLLLLKADPNFVCKQDNQTALHHLVAGRQISTIKALLNCSVNTVLFSKDNNGATPIIEACAQPASRSLNKLIEVLVLSTGCKLAMNFVDNSGLSALAYALKFRNVGAVQLLLRAGASVLTLSSSFLHELLEPCNSHDTHLKDTNEEEKQDLPVESEQIVIREETLEDFNAESAVGSHSAVRVKPSAGHTEPHSHTAASRATRNPEIVADASLSTDKAYFRSLDRLILQHSIDYHSSYFWINALKTKQSLSKAQLCQKLINFRLIEEERECRKAVITYSNASAAHLAEGHNYIHINFIDDKQVVTLSDRVKMRSSRKKQKLRRRVPLESKKAKQEMELWDLTRARILKRVDEQYNTNIHLKGLFK